jgi:hypothetical protein
MVIPVEHTKGEYWGGTQLSYTIFKWTSIFLGFFGVDHLLLRSPTTAAIKFIGNILTLGYFYFYDFIQVLTEEDVIKTKGLSMPFFGYMGIGEGIFIKPGTSATAPKTSPKPYLFMIYCIAVLIGFGTDFLVAGDLRGAAAKIFSLFPLLLWGFTFIFWFFTFLWYIYNIIRTFGYTKDVLSTNKDNKYRGIGRFFPFTAIMKPYHIPFNTFIPLGEVAKECDKALGFPWNVIAAFWTAPANAAKTVIQSAVEPAKIVLEKGVDVVKASIDVVKIGTEAVGKTVNAAADLATKAPQIIQDSQSLISKIQEAQAVPSVPSVHSMPSVPSMPSFSMKGGAISSTQEKILLGSFIGIVLGGFGLTLFRGLKNGDSADDRPPESRTSRKSLF